MTRSSIHTKIKILLVMLVLSWAWPGFINTAWAQYPTPATANQSGAGGNPAGTVVPGSPNGRVPPVSNGAPPYTPPDTGMPGRVMPGGMESGQPNLRTFQDAANQQPTLGGGSRQPGTASGGARDNVQDLKSVREQSHPYYGFVAEFKRDTIQTHEEKDVYLHEILSGVTSSAQRRELLRAYWNLSEKLLHCYVRLAQRHRLQLAHEWMQKELLPTDQIDLALQLVSQQYRAAELEFIQAQYRFLDLQSRIPASSARWRVGYGDEDDGWFDCDDAFSQTPADFTAQKPDEQPLPVPADFPLAVPYNTKVDELKKQRTLSQKSLLLNRTIPLQYEVVVARTAARAHSNNQWQAVLLNHKQSPVTQIESLAREEMALISTIIEYNHQVDEFVLETFGTNIPEKQLLASILVLPKRPEAGAEQSRSPLTSTYQQ